MFLIPRGDSAFDRHWLGFTRTGSLAEMRPKEKPPETNQDSPEPPEAVLVNPPG
jgi:hypothetical protein